MVTSAGTQPVVSMVSGKVNFVSSESTAPNSGGNAVEIHGIDGLDYYYAHLSAPLQLKIGETINAGQQLGFAGNSGNAKTTPPHLHIGIGHGISEGVGAPGGVGLAYDAVSALKSLQASPSANNPDIVSSPTQTAITTSQAAGTIQLGAPTQAPITTSLADRIRWLASLLQAAGVDPSKIPTMVAVSLAENGSSNPSAHSTTSDVGLWQINVPVWLQALQNAGIVQTAKDLEDPEKNAKAAAYVLAHQGLNAWTTFQAGLHNSWVGQVQAALAGVDLGGGVTSPTPQPGGGNACDCPNVSYGPITIPDIGCTIACAIGKVIEEWKRRWVEWWDTWTGAHAANVLFVLVGGLLVVVGVGALIAGNKDVQAMAKTAVMA